VELDAWIEGEWRSWGFRQGVSWEAVLARCRLLVAAEHGELSGGAASSRFTLTVPGGELPVAAVASVWVSPVRRGEGIFRRLVEAQLESFADEGMAASVLIAAQPALYRGFGYGVASLAASLRVAVAGRWGRPPAKLTLVDREAGLAAAATVYDELRPAVPGMLDRPEEWWLYAYPPEEPDEGNPTLFVLHGEPGACDGYAAYSVREAWTADGRPDNALVLHELVSGSPAAYESLWAYCLGSGCAHVEAENRPVDEPLLHVLEDAARLQTSVVDGLHVRILDVEQALTARSYSSEGELALSVRDDGGRDADFLLTAGTDGAECTRTRRAPELALDVSALGCAYLGGASFESLRLAGCVEELRPGAARQADRLFSWSPAPWLPWDY
jgi:predicted acetyltransferase